ncbi:MAG: helix-turn-helix transcriptional regulator [Hyphomicrobium sp.]|nr:helix-turn-helix transcriptional regulator [Hyphomicrobium sp.]
MHLVSLYAFASTDDASTVRPLLSSREREVLTWTAQGKSTWDVGQILGISQQTVATHLKNSKFKLDTTTVTHTVVQALRRREIEL